MIKRLRIAALLCVLLFVIVADLLDRQRLGSWDRPLWVEVYPVLGEPASPDARRFVESFGVRELQSLEFFFASQARRYGLGLDAPIRFELAHPLERELPAPPESALGAIAWSLRMRWLAARLDASSDNPTPDITLFTVYHDGTDTPTLERSMGLRKGRIAVAHLFAEPSMSASNEVVIAHELLHTLGALDRYDPATTLPLFPDGYVDALARPLYPQRQAELMAGRIPLSQERARTPGSLGEVIVGPLTAAEIGWPVLR